MVEPNRGGRDQPGTQKQIVSTFIPTATQSTHAMQERHHAKPRPSRVRPVDGPDLVSPNTWVVSKNRFNANSLAKRAMMYIVPRANPSMELGAPSSQSRPAAQQSQQRPVTRPFIGCDAIEAESQSCCGVFGPRSTSRKEGDYSAQTSPEEQEHPRGVKGTKSSFHARTVPAR